VDIATDAIIWSDNTAAVFPDIPAASLASGAEFSKLIERSARSGQTRSVIHPCTVVASSSIWRASMTRSASMSPMR
jgi:hypothetical protein